MNMEVCDLRISGGKAVLLGLGVVEVDILVKNGKIDGFCQSESLIKAKETVSAKGLTILPGAIDAHVHLSQDLTIPKSQEDILPESAAAAAGGVTTFIAYLMSPQQYEQIFRQVVEKMEANSLVDFGLHFCICTGEQKASIPSYTKNLGVSSYKIFMNFRTDEGKYLGIPGNDDGFLFEVLQTIAETGGMLCPHAENIELIRVFKEDAMNAKGNPLLKWHMSRPAVAESEALQRAAYLAGVTKASFYAVHVTCKESLEVIRGFKTSRERVFIETCPHYLTHDVESDLNALGKVNPPLRTSSDREALWKAIESGLIDTIGSDHVPRVKSAKDGNIWEAAAGFPGMETILPIFVSEAHVKRHIPLERVVGLLSTNPAQIFGLAPQKGAIRIGADADLAVVDLKGSHRIEADKLQSVAGYSIYEGWTVNCRPVHTLVRGHFVQKDGELQTAVGHGKYCPRPNTCNPMEVKSE